MKQERKDWIEELNAIRVESFDYIDLYFAGTYLLTSGRYTYCINIPCDDACMLHISWAVASVTENKIRRKVGEYFAMQRMMYGGYLPIPAYTDLDALDALINL